jgi:hypothetical protein
MPCRSLIPQSLPLVSIRQEYAASNWLDARGGIALRATRSINRRHMTAAVQRPHHRDGAHHDESMLVPGYAED